MRISQITFPAPKKIVGCGEEIGLVYILVLSIRYKSVLIDIDGLLTEIPIKHINTVH